MARNQAFTHVYSLRTGWSRTKKQVLTRDLAIQMRAEGITMVRVPRSLFKYREVSIIQYLYRGEEVPVRRTPNP